MHNLKHAQIDRRILFRALKLLEETVAAHPFFEEASQHAVLSPDTAVLVRQIFHDVIGAGGKRIFRGFNLVGRSVDCIKTPDHQDEILRSRLEATRVLGMAVRNVDTSRRCSMLEERLRKLAEE